MAANLRFVAHATERHAHELAIGGACDRSAQRGLAHARGAYQAQDGALQLAHPLLYREIFEDAFLDLLQPVMILFQHVFSLGQVAPDLGAFFPRYADQPIDVIAHHGRFRRHRRHHLQLVQFGVRLLAGLFRHAGGLDLALQVLDLVGRVIHFTQFLLNGLHLFVEVVLALAFLHLLLDAAANALLDVHQVDLALDLAHDVLEALTRVTNLENLLLLIEFQ